MSKNLPTVTSSIPRDLRNFVDRLRDIVNGNGSSRLVSAQDLVSAGIANLTQSGVLSAAVVEGVTYGTPPAPTGVSTAAAINNVIVTWDDPDYPGHAYAEVWGSSTNNLGDAVVLGLAPGATYTDPLGPSTTRYYWVRFINIQDLAGPYNAVNGTVATTGADVDYLLDTLAGQISTTELTTDFNTRLNGIEANATAISSEATTRANADGTINAKYTVKIDNAGHISGFGLISDANNATPYAAFGVRANQFFIAPPATVQTSAPTSGLYVGYVWVDSSVTPNVTKYYTGSGWTTTPQALPFVVQASPTTVGSVSVPAGVYMDAAFIKNATITNAKIADLAVDNAKISDLGVDKLSAGVLKVGSYIESQNFVSGTQGFKIYAGGAVEFSTATIRGTVYASAGTFAGSLSGATGTFSGSMTVGTNPAISGTTMTGTGATITSGGNFAFGNSTTNMVFNGSSIYMNGFQQLSSSSLTGGLIASGAAGSMQLIRFTVTAAAANKPLLIITTGSFFCGNPRVNGVYQYTGTTWFQNQGQFYIQDTSNNVVFTTGLWYVPAPAIRLNTNERTGAFPLAFATMVTLSAGTYDFKFNVSATCEDNVPTWLGLGDTYYETVRSIVYVSVI